MNRGAWRGFGGEARQIKKKGLFYYDQCGIRDQGFRFGVGEVHGEDHRVEGLCGGGGVEPGL